jgi:hypothetical protein
MDLRRKYWHDVAPFFLFYARTADLCNLTTFGDINIMREVVGFDHDAAANQTWRSACR